MTEAPTYMTERYGEASVVDAVATVDEDRAAVFLVNRDLVEAAQVTIDVRSLGSSRIAEAVTLADSDAYARNTLAEQHRVTPVREQQRGTRRRRRSPSSCRRCHGRRSPSAEGRHATSRIAAVFGVTSLPAAPASAGFDADVVASAVFRSGVLNTGSYSAGRTAGSFGPVKQSSRRGDFLLPAIDDQFNCRRR